MYRKRLKNVYELLESGNNKKVVQEVDKLLSSGKTNNEKEEDEEKLSILTIARPLKSLALLRMGRQDEAEKIINELLDANTKDENALNVVMQYCKETQQLGKIVLFYENAVKNSPAFDEELYSSLFYAYVRNRDYAKQQQCAIKLYKETSQRVYLCWNAMSYFLMYKYQSSDANNKVNAMNLQLAEKLLEKQFKEKKLESGGEFQLYLLILETKGDYKSALKILDQADLDLDSKTGLHNFTLEKRIDYLKALDDWNELKSVCESKLEDSLLVDNWRLYLTYIESLEKTSPNLEESEVEKVIEKFNSIQKSRSNEKIQGPYLAKIEFTARRKLVDKCKKYLREYAETFAGKPGFIYDLERFAPTIHEFNLVEFMLKEVLEPLFEANKPPFQSIKSIYTCLSYFQFKRRYSPATPLDADQLESMYLSAVDSSFGRELLSTAYQYADEFLLLAVYARDAPKSGDDAAVLRLISNLKLGLVNSPSNHQLKLALINLYSHLGAYDAMQTVYDSMEIKNIQNYSISYLMLTQCLRLGSATTNSVVTSAYQFFNSNLFDLANFLVNCYKYGTFLKLIEFIEFMQAVRQSFTYALSMSTYASSSIWIGTEADVVISATNDDELRSYLGQIGLKLSKFVKENTSSFPFELNTLLSSKDDDKFLTDYSDKDILYNWESNDRRKEIENDYGELINEQRSLIKLRFLLVHFLTDAINVYNQSGKETSSNMPKIESYLKEFGSSIKSRYNDESTKSSSTKVNPFSPKSSYLRELSELGLIDMIMSFTRLATSILQNKSFLDDEVSRAEPNKTLIDFKNELSETFTRLRQRVGGYLSELDKSSANLTLVAKLLESLSSSLEAVSFCLVLFVALVSSAHVKPTWIERTKKSKKKKEAYLKYSATIDAIHDIHELLANVCAYFVWILRDRVTDLTGKSDRLFAGVEATFKNINPNTDTTRFTAISASYSKSFDELKRMFNSKLKILFKLSSNSVDLQEFVDSVKSKF